MLAELTRGLIAALARISRQAPTATALCRSLRDLSPVRALDMVSTMPALSSLAIHMQRTTLSRLGNCSDTSDRCMALLRGAEPLHIHVHIATKSGKKCVPAPGPVRRL